MNFPKLKTILNNPEMAYFFLDLFPDEEREVLRLEELLLETEREEEPELREE